MRHNKGIFPFDEGKFFYPKKSMENPKNYKSNGSCLIYYHQNGLLFSFI